MGFGNSKPEKDKGVVSDPTTMKWYYKEGEGCSACPAHLYQNCEAKFGVGWGNCGESGCTGSGCEARCCLSAAQQAINNQKALAAAAAAKAAAEAARRERLRSTCNQLDSSGTSSNLMTNIECQTWCTENVAECDAAKKQFCSANRKAKECSCIFGEQDPAYQQWRIAHPEISAPMPCVQPACRQTDLVSMLIPTEYNTANVKCPDIQLQQIQTSGLSIGSNIGVQSGKSGGASIMSPMVMIALLLIFLFIIIGLVLFMNRKNSDGDDDEDEGNGASQRYSPYGQAY